MAIPFGTNSLNQNSGILHSYLIFINYLHSKLLHSFSETVPECSSECDNVGKYPLLYRSYSMSIPGLFLLYVLLVPDLCRSTLPCLFCSILAMNRMLLQVLSNNILLVFSTFFGLGIFWDFACFHVVGHILMNLQLENKATSKKMAFMNLDFLIIKVLWFCKNMKELKVHVHTYPDPGSPKEEAPWDQFFSCSFLSDTFITKWGT